MKNFGLEIDLVVCSLLNIINVSNSLILMPKKSKKERPAFDFKEVEEIKQPEEYSANNSSSIIAVQDYSHQSSLQNLTFMTKHVDAKIIKIGSPKKIDFEDEIEYKTQQTPQKSINKNRQNRKSPVIEIIESKQQELDQKKQTVTTNNDSNRQKIHIKNVEAVKFQEKIETQHVSYGGRSEESEEEEEEEEEEQEVQVKSQPVYKNFVADSFEDLIFSQIPPKCNVTCAIKFKHEILSLSRKYDLYLVRQKKYLLSAVKERIKLTSEFIFEREGKKQSPVGNLKSNFTGLEYVINKYHKNQQNRVTQIGWIGYEFNLLGLSHQRTITVIKNINAKLQKIPFFSQIKNYYENGVTSNFQKFVNKKAIQNNQGEYQLDFHGKVAKPSSKNFILTNLKDKQCILFGKRTDNSFVLQIGYPFSIFQGFAIAVSSLDHKLCVR